MQASPAPGPSSHRLFRFAVSGLAVSVVSIGSACTSGSPSNTSDGKAAGSLANVFASELGHSLGEVNSAYLERQYDAIRQCIRDRGFEPTQRTKYSGAGIREVQAPRLGHILEEVAETALGNEADSASLPAPQTQQYIDAQADCIDEAGRDSDPIASFMDWVTIQNADQTARAFSDPAAAEASDDLSMCLGDAGLAARTEADLLNYVSELVDPIVVAYASGDIDRTMARARFDDAIDVEHRLAVSVGPCLDKYQTSIQQILERVQNEFVESHAEQVIDKLREIREELGGSLDSYYEEPDSASAETTEPALTS